MRTQIEKIVTVRKIMLALFIATSLSGFAQVQDTLYVYKAGTLSSKLAVADVDSITFTPPAKSTNKEISNFIYSLVVNDYSFISLAAQAIATNGNEFDAAKAIGTNKLFIDTLSASNFIPLLLTDKYNNAGELSTALITYNFYNPCDTSKIVATNKYTLITTDYDAMGTSTGLPGQYDYFSPTIDPNFYIPIWLKINNPYAKLNDIKLIRYKYWSTPTITQRATVFQFNGSNWEVYNSTKQTTAKFKLKNKKWLNCNILSGLNDGIGDFIAVSLLGDQVWGWSTYKFMLMTGYLAGTYNDNEDWLISPAMDFTNRTTPYLIFSHVGRYFGDVAPSTDKMHKAISIWVSTKSGGTTINPNDWEQLIIPEAGYPSGLNWTFISSTPISLAKYIGQANVRIAFKYLSSSADNAAGNWEVKNVNVFDE